MTLHLSNFAPALARVAGRIGIEKTVRLGISRAKGYGFTNCGPVALYLEFMSSLGCNFDTDPQYPWAGAVLNNSEHRDQTWRASQLYRSGENYFNSVFGQDEAYARAALKNALRAGDLAEKVTGDLTQTILGGFQMCYAEKFTYVGEDQLRLLVSESIVKSESYGIRSDRSRALLAVLSFTFGHGAFHDPLYPWIDTALSDKLVESPDDRAERLYSRVQVYLNHAIEGLS